MRTSRITYTAVFVGLLLAFLVFMWARHNEQDAFLSEIRGMTAQDIVRIEISQNTYVNQTAKVVVSEKEDIEKVASALKFTEHRGTYKLDIEELYGFVIYLNNSKRLDLDLVIDRGTPGFVIIDDSRWPGGTYKNSALVDWTKSLFHSPRASTEGEGSPMLRANMNAPVST